MDANDAACDIKISDFQGFFDLAFQVLGSEEFSWDAFLDKLTSFPGLTDENKELIRAGIEIIQNNPLLVELSKETVDQYLAEYGDIPICELSERIEVANGNSNPTPTNSTSDLNEIAGTAASETVDGTDAKDKLLGLAGDDILVGGAEADVLIGGEGNDTLYADAFESALTLVTGVINRLWGGLGDDQLYAGNSTDILGGGVGSDYLQGGDNDDTLYGGADLDEIDGRAGSDLIFAGDGDDFVEARDGDDTIWGGAGDDNLDGGAGADTFRFITGSGNDEIWSFSASDDTLNLSETDFDFTSIDDVVARATTETNAQNFSGVLIDLGGENSIWLAQFDIADVANLNVAF